MLLGLLLFSGLTAGVMTTIGYYTQLYYHSIGFSLAAIGLLLAIPVVPDALFAAAAPRIMRWLPRRWVLAIFVGAQMLGLLALATRVPALALVGYLGLLHVGDSVLYPAISTYLNERSPEAQRATVLSLETGLFSAIMIVLFPLFGFGLTRIDFSVAYLWTFVALLLGSVGIVALVWVLRRRGKGAHRTHRLNVPSAVLETQSKQFAIVLWLSAGVVVEARHVLYGPLCAVTYRVLSSVLGAKLGQPTSFRWRVHSGRAYGIRSAWFITVRRCSPRLNLLRAALMLASTRVRHCSPPLVSRLVSCTTQAGNIYRDRWTSPGDANCLSTRVTGNSLTTRSRYPRFCRLTSNPWRATTIFAPAHLIPQPPESDDDRLPCRESTGTVLHTGRCCLPVPLLALGCPRPPPRTP